MIAEGLFAHFFSPQRQPYHPEDISWFLKLTNEEIEDECSSLETSSGLIPHKDVYSSPEANSGLTSQGVDKCSVSEADLSTPQVDRTSSHEYDTVTPSGNKKETMSALLKVSALFKCS